MNALKLTTLRETLVSLQSELNALTTEIETTLAVAMPPVATSTTLAVPSTLAKRKESFAPAAATQWMAEQLQEAVSLFNGKLGPHDSRVTLPAVRTLEERILPLLGDFEGLQRLYDLIEGARYTVWVRRRHAATGRLRLQPVEFGPSWVKPVELLEAGETFDTVEYVYHARRQYPDVSINFFLKVFHENAWDDGTVFDQWLDCLNEDYWGIAPGSRMAFVARSIYLANELYGGSLADWIWAYESEQREARVMAQRSTELPMLSRWFFDRLQWHDEEFIALRHNIDREFSHRKRTKKWIGGEYLG